MSSPNPLQDILKQMASPLPNPNAMPQQQDKSPEEAKKDSTWEDIQKQELDALQNFSVARIYLQTLVKSWEEECRITDANRLTRDIEVDVDILRENGDLEDDECFIPDRIIDSNIQREMPSYINFLKNSRRIAIFTDTLDATFDTQLLEAEFTKKLTYKGWIKPWYKILDGGMTHAWASFEVMYDESKPGHVATEYIAHEDLLFPHDSKDIQASSCILRRYHPTALQLKAWCINRGFDIGQVELVIQKYEEAGNKDRTIEVFKRFCKYNGVVYVSWFSLDSGAVDWLKKPTKLYCGIDESVTNTVNVPMPSIDPMTGQPTMVSQPQQQQSWQKVDINNYPIFMYFYRESEKPYLFDRLGRVQLDRDKQSANTAILTAFVNGCNRAMKIYASPAADTVNDGKPAKQLANIKWANGGIFDKPMVFWNMPYPDSMLLKALEYFDTSNSQDIGQTDFAANNRQDSRKTATEIKAASQQSQLLDSVDLTNFSEFCREVFSFAWQIVQSQALQNKIKFLLIKNPAPTPPQPSAGALPMQAPQQQPALPTIVNSAETYQDEISSYINDQDTLVRNYDVRAAGDVDVIQRDEMEESMMSDWPVIQNTPLASRFLCDLIKLKYPEDGEVYASILNAGDPRNIIMSLGTIVQALVALPEVKQHLTPQMMQQLSQIEQQVMAVLQPPSSTPSASPAGNGGTSKSAQSAQSPQSNNQSQASTTS